MKKAFLFLLLACAFVACQQNGYTISGTAEGFADGDTLFLSNDLMTAVPSDTLVVKNERFELKGEVDSVQLYLLYSIEHGASVLFFIEPGTINVSLSKEVGQSKVGGTKVNDGWQSVSDLTASYGERIQQIYKSVSGQVYVGQEDKAQLDSAMSEVSKLEAEMTQKVLEIAEKNIDNELGYVLVTNLPEDDNMTSERRSGLIAKMPEKFRQRSAVQEFLRSLEAAKFTEKGQKINDFAFATPDGDELIVMSVVSQNQLTILDFWASWCGPCRQEMPFMVSLYKKYHDKGLGIVGISLDEDHDAWVSSIGELGIKWPQMSDLKGWKSEAAQMFQVNAIPFMVIVDQQGTIIEKGLRGDELERFISEQLP